MLEKETAGVLICLTSKKIRKSLPELVFLGQSAWTSRLYIKAPGDKITLEI